MARRVDGGGQMLRVKLVLYFRTKGSGYTSLYNIVGKTGQNRTGFFEIIIKFEQIIKPG